jgi:hypothetical protein
LIFLFPLGLHLQEDATPIPIQFQELIVVASITTTTVTIIAILVVEEP